MGKRRRLSRNRGELSPAYDTACRLCGAPLPPSGPRRSKCYLCEDRWLDFQCRALVLKQRAEEAVARRRAGGKKIPHADLKLLQEGLALCVARFFLGCPGDGFSSAKIGEVYPYHEDVPGRIFGRLSQAGSVKRLSGGRPERAGWTITHAGTGRLEEFFELLDRLGADHTVMTASRHNGPGRERTASAR